MAAGLKIKIQMEFSVSESGLEDAMTEFDEITVEGLIKEIVDKAVDCDELRVQVVDGPNTLEEFDQQS